MNKFTVVFFASLFLSATVFAQQNTPCACSKAAQGVSAGMSVGDIHREIERRRTPIDNQLETGGDIDARECCILAELMKSVGDYSAAKYYTEAIKADSAEPAYDYCRAEYYRNFRGPQRPIFPKAEDDYFRALRKLKDATDSRLKKEQVERGLTALYQRDGVPLLLHEEQPYLFFTTISDYARNTSDFDRRSEVRDFTSEALFSESKGRLNKKLTEDQLRGIIRAKDQFETFSRLRFRYRSGPAIDLTYKYREINQAQITNFFEPNKFNDVNLSEYGIAVEKPFDTHLFDLFLRGGFKRARRVGIIEFLPRNKEDINQFEANAALSLPVGPDKVNFEFTYVFQDIKEDRPPNPLKRDRSIYAGKFTYQLFRQELDQVHERRFETRGIDLFGGALYDNETFGVVDVNKYDYFIGASLKGFKGFDFTVQPTIFTSDVERDPSQKNSQLRTNAVVLYRLFDEEKQEGNPGFLHLVIPFSRDVAIDGPNSFENYKIGAGLNAKLFAMGKHRTTFLASLKYDYQNFFKLRKGVDLYSVNLSIGF